MGARSWACRGPISGVGFRLGRQSHGATALKPSPTRPIPQARGASPAPRPERRAASRSHKGMRGQLGHRALKMACRRSRQALRGGARQSPLARASPSAGGWAGGRPKPLHSVAAQAAAMRDASRSGSPAQPRRIPTGGSPGSLRPHPSTPRLARLKRLGAGQGAGRRAPSTP